MFDVVYENGWYCLYMDDQLVDGFDNARDAVLYAEWLLIRGY